MADLGIGLGGGGGGGGGGGNVYRRFREFIITAAQIAAKGAVTSATFSDAFALPAGSIVEHIDFDVTALFDGIGSSSASTGPQGEAGLWGSGNVDFLSVKRNTAFVSSPTGTTNAGDPVTAIDHFITTTNNMSLATVGSIKITVVYYTLSDL